MKINSIRYNNFRNFKDQGRIDFPTDGTITIIYGPNGVGKTTLHQLFQWIFYGEVHFNKTASSKMYNLEYEQECNFGDKFSVRGIIDFEQPDIFGNVEYYSISREWRYLKQLTESKKIEETVHILKKIDDDWKPLSGNPEDIIEKILPKGLSQYFFFDGESMIADLNQKGRDSAKSLRKALYSIFDLDIYEQAMSHIGSIESSGTVLGRLYIDKSQNSSDSDVINARGLFRQTQKKIEDLEQKINSADSEINDYNAEIKELSEKIGSTPSREKLESDRTSHKNSIKLLEGSIKEQIKSFGRDVIRQYPYLFLSRIVEEAKYRIGLKIEDETLIPGLSKELLLSLQNEETCICGRPIGETEHDCLNEWLKKFPPLSYKYVYDQFKKSAARWTTEYDPEVLMSHIKAIFNFRDEIEKHQKSIQDIDYELSNETNVDQYIEKRNKDENSIEFWEKERNKANQEVGVQRQYLKQREKKYNEVVAANSSNKEVDVLIDVMTSVYNYFSDKLESSAQFYSSELCKDIQSLLNQMLTSVRTVEMTSNFELKVKDSYGDEAKSEGQFAVVSFAYIGGIFKLLSEVPELKGKEFPLILDGPFSKLDAIQRQNVIKTIPSYAPQIILFSKDDLSSCVKSVNSRVWTIYSNEERNVSYVKQGYDQEVFIINED